MAIKYSHRGARSFDDLLRAIDLILKSIDETKFDKSGGTVRGDVVISDTLNVSGAASFDSTVTISGTATFGGSVIISGSSINIGDGRIILSGSTFHFQQFDGSNFVTLGTIP